MMHHRCELLIALVATAGCNEVFGLDRTVLIDAGDESDAAPPPPDRDRDDIFDHEDPCIAGIADDKGDLDFDGIANESDACPDDYESADGDGDNIYDECDPLPSLGNDRRRCFMGFQSAPLNFLLWHPRGGDWDLIHGGLWATTATGETLVAAESLEAPSVTSFDMKFDFSVPATAAMVTFWLRTSDTAAATDLGCEIRGTSSMTTITVKGSTPEQATTVARSVFDVARIQATISAAATGSNNVRCAAQFDGVFPATGIAAQVALPPGRVGITAQGTPTYVTSLLVVERDSVPML